MTRAERAAEKAYPPFVVKTMYGEFDCNYSSRLLFWRGYKQALEEMLEDAVEAEVVQIFPEGAASVHYQPGFGIGEMAYFCKADGLNAGDKVRIVILKDNEDESK